MFSSSTVHIKQEIESIVRPCHDDTGRRLWRRLGQAEGCRHQLLSLVGIFAPQWKGIGSFWVGAMAVAAGISGIYVTQAEPYGGMATGFYFFLSVITLAASLVSVVLGEGAAFLVVSKTDGNCFDGDDCPTDFCASEACVCWEPDTTDICEDAGSVRHCLRYGGDSCGDIGDSEGLLLGSSIVLLMIALFSFSSLLVAASTCFSCKRTIIVDSIENANAYG
ncbi:unnamed protein product [Scytosiphon promiscuus]